MQLNPRYVALARQASMLSTHPKHKMGAVLVRKGKILALGCNKIKTHVRSTHPHKMIHAELDVILNARQDVSGADLYIVRYTKAGEPALSLPCVYCHAMLSQLGIRRVFHTVPNGFAQLTLVD